MACAALLEAARSVKSNVVHFSLPDDPSHLLQAGIPLEVSGTAATALGAAEVTSGNTKHSALTHYSDGRPHLRGVTLDVSQDAEQPNAHRWRCTVRFQGAEYALGSFSAAAAAGLAWDAAAMTLVGINAATNFPVHTDVHDAAALYGPPLEMLHLPGYSNEDHLSFDFPRNLCSTEGLAHIGGIPGSTDCANILDLVPPPAAARAAYHNDSGVAAAADLALWQLGCSSAETVYAPRVGDSLAAPNSPSTPVHSASGGGRAPRTPHSARRRLAAAAAAASSPEHNHPEQEDAKADSSATASSRSRSGFRGVTYMPRQDRCWQARIFHAGKFVYLGVFREAEEAAAAYDEAARRLKGYAARLNFPAPGESGATPRKETSGAGGGLAAAETEPRDGLQIALPPAPWGRSGSAGLLGSLVHSVLPQGGTAASHSAVGPRGWVPGAWFLAPPRAAAATKRSREDSSAEQQLHAVHTASPMRVRLSSRGAEEAEQPGMEHHRLQRVPGTSVVPLASGDAPIFVHTDGFYKYATPGSHSFDPLEVTSVGASYTHAPPPPFRVYPTTHTPGAWGAGQDANSSKQFPGVCRGRPNSVSGEDQWYVAVDRVGTTRWLGPFPSEVDAARGGDVAKLVLEGTSAATHFHWDKSLFFAAEVATFSSVPPLSHPADSLYAALGDLKKSLLSAAQSSAGAQVASSSSSPSGSAGRITDDGVATPPKRRRRGGSLSMPTAGGMRTVSLSSLTTSPHALGQALSPDRAAAAAEAESSGQTGAAAAADSGSSAAAPAVSREYNDARLRALSAAAFLDAAGDGRGAEPTTDATITERERSGAWGEGAIKRV